MTVTVSFFTWRRLLTILEFKHFQGVFSALEVFYVNALYKFTFDTDINIDLLS